MHTYMYSYIHLYNRDPTNLRHSELTCKLETAFLSGLRYHQVSIREKFFEACSLSSLMLSLKYSLSTPS